MMANSQYDKLVGRSKRLGRLSEPKHGSHLKQGKIIGQWQAGDKIPTRKLTGAQMQYIGQKRHESALKKYKKQMKKMGKSK